MIPPSWMTTESARQFVRDHELPDVDEVPTMNGGIELRWESPDDCDAVEITFAHDGTVSVFIERPDFAMTDEDLPTERLNEIAVGLARRWAGVETDRRIPGFDTPLVVLSFDLGSWVLDFLFDFAARTVEPIGEDAERADMSGLLSTLMDFGTEIGGHGARDGWGWTGNPHRLAGAVRAAGIEVSSCEVYWG